MYATDIVPGQASGKKNKGKRRGKGKGKGHLHIQGKAPTKEQERERFLAVWRNLGLPPLEVAERLGVDPALALAWAREWRNGGGKEENLASFFHRLLHLAQRAKELAEGKGQDLSPHALMALSKLGGMIPLLEEAWLEVSSKE